MASLSSGGESSAGHSERSDGEGSAGSSQEEPMRVPDDILTNLRRFLLPGASQSRWRLRLYATSFTVVGTVAGFLGMRNIQRALANETLEYGGFWSFLQAETLINQALVGMVATECTVVLGEAVLSATTPPGERDGTAAESSFYLSKLLHSEVSRSVYTQIDRRTRLCFAQATLLVVALISLPMRTAITALTSGVELGADLWASYVCMMVVWVPVLFIFAGWLLFFQVPMIVVGDHIARIASGVQALSRHSRPINFDALTRSVCHAHDLQRHLSALLAPLLKTVVLLACLMAEHFTLLAIAPRRGIGPAVLPQRWHFAIAAMLFVLALGWPLRGAAATTRECAQLTTAISALRVRNLDTRREGMSMDGMFNIHGPVSSMDGALNNRQSLTLRSRSSPTGAAADHGPHLATMEELAQIEALLDYVRGLNRGQGIGFVFWNTTITTVSRPHRRLPSSLHALSVLSDIRCNDAPAMAFAAWLCLGQLNTVLTHRLVVSCCQGLCTSMQLRGFFVSRQLCCHTHTHTHSLCPAVGQH